MNDLVRIDHMELRADSRKVAEILGIDEDSMARLLRERSEELRLTSADFKSEMVKRKQGGGQAKQFAMLTERQCLILITFVRNSEEAVKAKIALVDAFLAMKEVLTDLIYRTVLGMSAKKYRETNGLEADASVRAHLTADQLGRVEQYERIVTSMVGAGFDYQTIKGMLEKRALPGAAA